MCALLFRTVAALEHCFCCCSPFPLSLRFKATNEPFLSFCFLRDQVVEFWVEAACPNATGVFTGALLDGGFTAAGGLSCAMAFMKMLVMVILLFLSVAFELYENAGGLIELENTDGVLFVLVMALYSSCLRLCAMFCMWR